MATRIIGDRRNAGQQGHYCEAGQAGQAVCFDGCRWIDALDDQTMTARVVLITPEIAKRWLRRNESNRLFSRENARSLAEEMSAGYWRENGESIVFDRAGSLIDGQHRLQGVVNSGHDYLCVVVTGIESEVRPTVDTGQKRTSANNLQMSGEKNASTLAATILLWRGYESRQVSEMTHPYKRTSISGILEYLGEWPELREAVQTARHLIPQKQGRAIMPSSEVAMVWYAIVHSGASRERANEFLGSVLSGFDLGPGNPILALRRRLMEHMRPGQRMHKRQRLALVLRAWQLWSTGQTRQVLRWEPEMPFPFL